MDTKEALAEDQRMNRTLGTDAVDSTRPIPDLVKYFSDRKQTDSVIQFYTRVFGRRKGVLGSHYLFVGLPLNTFPEFWDGVLPTRYFEPFDYKCMMPKVITTARHRDKHDPLTGYMKLKNDWTASLNNNLTSIAKTKHTFEKLNSKVIYCKKSVVDSVMHIHKDPDIYFNSVYNWYYAGNGNMHLLNIVGEDYLLHSEFSILYLSKFSIDNLDLDYDHTFTFDCGKENNILETCHNNDNLTRVVALRLMKRVVLLIIAIIEDGIEMEEIQGIDYELPLTSISFDAYHKNILYVTQIDNKLTIVNTDITKGRSVKLSETDNLVDNWNSVVGMDSSCYLHVARTTVDTYDKRTNAVVDTISGLTNVTTHHCDVYTAVKKCDEIPFVYLGSNHHLFLVDLRMNKKNRFLQRWTHTMESPPVKINVCQFENRKDLVCPVSQWYEGSCVFPNDSDRFDKDLAPNSIAMPLELPTIEATLKQARRQRKCLDLHSDLQARMYTTFTGSFVIERNEKYLIFLQTALGDIYCHTLYPSYLDIEDDAVDYLDKWSKGLNKRKNKFETSEVYNIALLWKSLKKVPKDMRLGGYSMFPDQICKYSEEEVLSTYESDQLDSGLLDIWLDRKANETVDVELHFSDSE